MLEFLARNRFSYIDFTYIVLAGSFISTGDYIAAAFIFVVGAFTSVYIEKSIKEIKG